MLDLIAFVLFTFFAKCTNCCFETPNDYENCANCWMTMTIVGISGKELAAGKVELYGRVQFTLWLSTFLSGRRQLASCGHIDASSWMCSRSETNCLWLPCRWNKGSYKRLKINIIVYAIAVHIGGDRFQTLIPLFRPHESQNLAGRKQQRIMWW